MIRISEAWGSGRVASETNSSGEQAFRYAFSNASQMRAGASSSSVSSADLLHLLAELDLHRARQRDAEGALQDIGDAALAGLAVDPHHRLVGPAQVRRVDGQVGHFPDRAVGLLPAR